MGPNLFLCLGQNRPRNVKSKLKQVNIGNIERSEINMSYTYAHITNWKSIDIFWAYRDSKQKIVLKLPETGGMQIEHSWSSQNDSHREVSLPL